MQIISLNRKTQNASKGIAIIVNAILFLVDFPDDTCEWFVTSIEVFAFLIILMISWNWRIKHLLHFYFKKLFKSSNF